MTPDPEYPPAASRTRTDPCETVSVDAWRTRLADTPVQLPRGESGAFLPVGSLIPGSVIVTHAGQVLSEGVDYELSGGEWAWEIRALPHARRGTDIPVSVAYSYSLLRLDSWVRTADGREEPRKGRGHITTPLPPELGPGETRLANLFADYHSNADEVDVFSCQQPADAAETHSTPGRIPETLSRIREGQAVTIVCWGDSVTCGGDASSPGTRYVARFAERLRKQFPGHPIHVQTVAVGGSFSAMWLFPDEYPELLQMPRFQECRWERVAEAHADLVTIEFVNDAPYDPAYMRRVYDEILRRTRSIGSELILITPHFTAPEKMGFTSLRQPECRPYVRDLLAFAERHELAVADASSRWGHLWKEGLPYVTLLGNGFNHPDDRGHAIFADELMKCFTD